MREWEAAPFRFDVIRSDAEDSAAYLRDSLDVVDALADRIENRLGYRIINAGGEVSASRDAPPDWLSTLQTARAHCASERRPGQALGLVIDTRPDDHRGGGASSATVWCAVVNYFRHRDDETLRPAYREAIVHELFHLFGFKHYGDEGPGFRCRSI